MRRSPLAFVLLTTLSLALASPAARGQEKKEAVKPIRALLVLGGCCHDYAKQKDILAKGIAERANVEVVVAFEPKGDTRTLNPVYNSDDWHKGFDVVIHNECSADVKDEEVIARILRPHKDGLPAVMLHCAMHSFRSKGFPKATPWFEFTGLASTGHGPQEPIEIAFTDKASPITKGLEDWKTGKEELYNNSEKKLHPTAQAVATGKQVVKARDGKERTDEAVVVWTNLYNGKAKVFATTLGHNNTTVADAKYLDLVTRGLLWSTGKLTDDGRPAAGYEAVKK
jgi:type 1 glutamine amidotransferase